MRISACWITKNEEKNIRRSILSVSRAADELIVVDTGSTDATVEIAQSLKARVIDFEWINDFAAARNFAIAKASGDVVIFLDADEWFLPALTRSDRQMIERAFSIKEIDCIAVRRTDVNEETFEAFNYEDNNIRIMRRRQNLLYYNSIHEHLRRKTPQGLMLPVAYMENLLNINHTGYSSNIIMDKVERNIELLEGALDQTEDPKDLFLFHSYLLRECKGMGNHESAFLHLQYMLDQPDLIKLAYQNYNKGFLGRLFIALQIGNMYRSKIDVKRLYDSFVLAAKGYYTDIEFRVIDLYYQVLFEHDPSRFHEKFAQLSSHLPAATDKIYSDYQGAVVTLKHQSAALHFALEEYDQSFALADEMVKNPKNYSSWLFSLIVDCLHGQADDMVIQYLWSAFDFSRPQAFGILPDILRMKEQKNAFLFLQKKQLDAGSLSKGEFLYLTLLNKNYEQLGDLVLSMPILEYQPDLAQEVYRQLFLAVVLNNQVDYYQRYRDRLTRYERLLDAYFAGVPLDEHTPDERFILMDNYHLLAFAGGVEAADRFASVYAANPLVCFVIKARYYYENRMDTRLSLLDREGVPFYSSDSYNFLCRSLIRCGKHGECLALLDELLSAGHYDDQWFVLLYVLRKKGRGDIAARAENLYERHLPLYQNKLDSPGIVKRITPESAQSVKQAYNADPMVLSLDEYRTGISPNPDAMVNA